MDDLQELFSAIENCDIERILSLAKSGADFNVANSKDCTPLLFAISKFCGKIAAIPLEENSFENQNAAFADIEKDAMSVISTLLENGANVHYETKDGCTPLGLLKFNLYLGMLSCLPSVAAGIIAQKKEVMHLVSKIFHDMTLILIEAGADENRMNKFDETSAKYAGRIMTGEMEKRRAVARCFNGEVGRAFLY